MNTIRIALITTMLAALFTTSCRQAADAPGPSAGAQDTSADEQAIAQVGEREIKAFSDADIEANLGVFTDDLVLMPPGQPMVRGKEAMRAWLQRGHEQFDFDIRYTDSAIEVVGDWAIQRYVTSGTLTAKADGATIEANGKGIHIYQRQPDGTWLIAQDIWNNDSSPAQNQAPKPEAAGGGSI